jgi:hypothetical protein
VFVAPSVPGFLVLAAALFCIVLLSMTVLVARKRAQYTQIRGAAGAGAGAGRIPGGVVPGGEEFGHSYGSSSWL